MRLPQGYGWLPQQWRHYRWSTVLDRKGQRPSLLRCLVELKLDGQFFESFDEISWVLPIEGRLFWRLPRKEKGRELWYTDDPELHRTSHQDLCRRDSKSDWPWLKRRYQCKQIKKDSLLPFKNHLKAPLPTTNQCPWFSWRSSRRNRDIYGVIASRRFQIKKTANRLSTFYGDFVGHCAGFLHH